MNGNAVLSKEVIAADFSMRNGLSPISRHGFARSGRPSLPLPQSHLGKVGHQPDNSSQEL